jgi:hypothetical protein
MGVVALDWGVPENCKSEGNVKGEIGAGALDF